VQQHAEALARRVLDELKYVGVLAIELFEVPGVHDAPPTLVFNEIAPRVHNSGHWTIDGARTSQFENHLRAVLGLPLGDCEMVAPGACAGMINLIGTMPARERLLALAHARVHDYAKPARPGRKIGHVTTVAHNHDALERQMREIEALIQDQ
jgi:5-(carboxyamino)imidazole ribonucleotide synthase